MGLSDLMERLAAFEPTDLPVISLYLNAQANQHGRTDFDRFLRKELPDRGKTYPPHTPQRESYDRDVEKINEYLKDVEPSANGIAIFACSGVNDFFGAVQLEAPLDSHRLYVYNQPHLYPLARLMDQYPRYGALVLDTNRARLFVFSRGTTQEKVEVESVKTKGTKTGGWSQMRFQRHLENYHMHHVKEVVDVLDQVVREENIEKIIVAGDDVVMPLLKEQLPKHLEEKVVDVISLDINTPEHEVFSATMESLREHDAHADAEKVNDLIEAYRSGGLGVVGAQDTLEALSMGQVEELFITASMRNIEGDKEDVQILADNDVPDPVVASSDAVAAQLEPDRLIVADDLITRAQQTSARITFVEDPALLAEFGGVGATLRYRI